MIENALRQSLPYINAHRGKLFVIFLDGKTISSKRIKQHINDITLLNSLGVKIVVVFGGRQQIDSLSEQQHDDIHFVNDNRITDKATLKTVKTSIGEIRILLESLFAQGLPYTSGFGFHSHCVSGNFVVSQPLGVVNGVDYEYTGKVRQIESASIQEQLKQNNIVMLSPLGISLTGDVFNCKAEEVARITASELKADKLIIFSDLKAHPELTHEVKLNQLNHLLLENTDSELARYLQTAKKAINNVARIHLIEREQDGSLLSELFTRDGSGVMISGSNYDEMRTAKNTDIQGLLNILQPLEEQGILVSRSKEELELDIEHFHIIERDGLIVASVALIPYQNENVAEVASLAVHADYQNRGYGNRLLVQIENLAKKNHVKQLFVLSTQTTHWFLERGFEEADVRILPKEKQDKINKQRNAKVFVKAI